MKAVVVLASLVALAVAEKTSFFETTDVRTETIEPLTKEKQYKVLELLETLHQVNKNAGYYKVGLEYDIKANVEHYKKKEVVASFLKLYEHDFLPKFWQFSIYNNKIQTQVKALYDLFYYAKDFETLYKTAAWARVHLNEVHFAYTFYIAIIQRIDTKDLVLPIFYELWPKYYTNIETLRTIEDSKMRGPPFKDFKDGIVESKEYYFYYANYSDYRTYGHDEYKLAYLTEDIGWNSYYTYFNLIAPFWEHGENIAFGLFKERRGEVYYYFYQQLLARYYMERLSNGLGEIPTFSWFQPFKYGYYPVLTGNFYAYAQRPNYYVLQTEKNIDDLRFVRNYEDTFLTFLEKGQFKAYNQEVDFYDSKSINFVGNFWQANPDLYEKVGKNNYYRSYEMAARRILGGASYSYKDYSAVPTALETIQTSLRDPAFYQVYNKIVRFMLQYKKNLQPYPQHTLYYHGVTVKDVEISELRTYFDFHSFNASNGVFYSDSEIVAPKKSYVVVQPRLNRDPFTVKINIMSNVEELATFKVFIGPKYDGKGVPIKFEDNWMNFVELDWFNYKLTKGKNVIERSSEKFFYFKEDSLSVQQIYKLLGENKLPTDMLENYYNLPKRLMLPRGTKSGFPLQFFVFVYPREELPKQLESLTEYVLDDTPFGYPFDRPVSSFFKQPNMYFKDALVYHKGVEYPYSFDDVYVNDKISIKF